MVLLVDLLAAVGHPEYADAREDLHVEVVDVEQVRVDSEPCAQVAENFKIYKVLATE